MSSNLGKKLFNIYKLIPKHNLRKFQPFNWIIRPNLVKTKSFKAYIKLRTDHYEKKYKGRAIEKWIIYWKYVYIDYSYVLYNVIKESKENPLKVSCYLAGLVALYVMVKLNPDERSFRDAMLRFSNEMILVHPSVRRQECLQYARLVEKCYNTNYLRYTNLGICSILWVDSYSSECGLYENQCSYFQLRHLKFINRIIDVGFLDKWWFLEKHMANYDIHESILS